MELLPGACPVTSPDARVDAYIARSADFAAALMANPAAKDAFAPSHRREYLEWILDAKREETRARHIAQAMEWLSDGKPRNWKYEAC